jgi:pimeloyl-ACP methyl ester carboxylesterase
VLVLVARNSPSSEAERRWDAYRNDGIAFVEASVPQAELIVMEDTIHDVPVQRPRELADALLRFVERPD